MKPTHKSSVRRLLIFAFSATLVLTLGLHAFAASCGSTASSTTRQADDPGRLLSKTRKLSKL